MFNWYKPSKPEAKQPEPGTNPVIRHGEKHVPLRPYPLQFFSYDHLPPELQEIARPFADLAKAIVKSLPENPERTAAMRKLLESKDCAVRSYLFK